MIKNLGLPRVLLVENDKRDLESYDTLLQHWGYCTVLAKGEGKTLFKDAITKARKYHCELALIDLRLMDDFDKEDISGLWLAGEISPTRTIILTGYQNTDMLRDFLENHKDIPYLSKADSAKKKRETLDNEALKVCAAKRNLQIDPPELTDQLLQTKFGSLIAKFPHQVPDILAQLFPGATNLRIERLDSRLFSTHSSDVPRPGSVVLKVYEGEYEPVVVKLARKRKIEIEVDNYEKFIARKVSRGLTARLERHTELWDIGGALYSYIGDFDVMPFSRYYEEHPIKDIRECLSSFFTVSWGRHYDKCRTRENVSLFELYKEVWGDWYTKSVQNFSTAGIWQEEQSTRVAGLPNPINWFKNRIAESQGQDASMVESTQIAVTHGDLHGDNLLIDSHKNTWVIDFERTREGHALQDFVELEADIINHLPTCIAESNSCYQTCLVIAGQKEIKELDKSDMEHSDPTIRKALQTISFLRALALKCTGISDARQYLLGLYFNMIFRATINNEQTYRQRQHQTLMMAAIFCHRLEHWNETWPPEDWKPLLNS
jgi:ActR/RegA family two-component response regulator